jgi:hypothetical protein
VPDEELVGVGGADAAVLGAVVLAALLASVLVEVAVAGAAAGSEDAGVVVVADVSGVVDLVVAAGELVAPVDAAGFCGVWVVVIGVREISLDRVVAFYDHLNTKKQATTYLLWTTPLACILAANLQQGVDRDDPVVPISMCVYE